MLWSVCWFFPPKFLSDLQADVSRLWKGRLLTIPATWPDIPRKALDTQVPDIVGAPRAILTQQTAGARRRQALGACKELAESFPTLSASVCDQLQLSQREQLDIHQLHLCQGHVGDPFWDACTSHSQKGCSRPARLTEWPICTLRTDRLAEIVLQLQGPDAPFQVHACSRAPVSTAGTFTSSEGLS